MLAVHLVKTYSFLSVFYNCEIWRLNNIDAKSIDATWNNVFLNKNFNGYWCESVKLLQ